MSPSTGLFVGGMSLNIRKVPRFAPAFSISTRDGWPSGRRRAMASASSTMASRTSLGAVSMSLMRSYRPQKSPYAALTTGSSVVAAAFLKLLMTCLQHRWISSRMISYTL